MLSKGKGREPVPGRQTVGRQRGPHQQPFPRKQLLGSSQQVPERVAGAGWGIGAGALKGTVAFKSV